MIKRYRLTLTADQKADYLRRITAARKRLRRQKLSSGDCIDMFEMRHMAAEQAGDPVSMELHELQAGLLVRHRLLATADRKSALTEIRGDGQ